MCQTKICKKTGKLCIDECAYIHDESEECIDNDFVHIDKEGKEIVQYSGISPIYLVLNDGSQWYKVTKMIDVFAIFLLIGRSTYILVAGNTAQGNFLKFYYILFLLQ